MAIPGNINQLIGQALPALAQELQGALGPDHSKGGGQARNVMLAARDAARLRSLQKQAPEGLLNDLAKVDRSTPGMVLPIGFDVEEILRRFEIIKNERSYMMEHWQAIAKVVSPASAVFMDEYGAPNTQSHQNLADLYDTTGTHSNELLSSGFFSLLTSPVTPWFQLVTNQDALNNMYEVNVWLNEISRILAYEIQRPQTSFTSAMHEFYLEYSAYGNATMFVTESQQRDSLKFMTLPLAECHFQENDYGHVDTLWRRYWRTPAQLIERFGEERVHAKVLDAYFNPQSSRRFEIIHAIMPNRAAQVSALYAVDLPFISVYIDKENKQLLSISGFNEQPFMAARFYKMPQEVYGRGPGSIALPDLNMLQEIMKTTLRGAQKQVDPPLMMPDQGFLTPPNTAPGRVNYFRAGSPDTDRILPLMTNGHPELGMDLIQSIQNRVREIFFVNQLQLNVGPQMTATEVMQRTEEKQRLMGPVIGRASTELLSPMLQRCFAILARANKFPPPPQAVQDAGAQFKIVYTSPIFKAQEQIAANNLQRAYEVLLPLIQASPQILDKFHPDRTVEEVGTMFNLNKKMFRTDREMQELAQARQQQMQQQEAATMLKDQGIGIRNLAQAAGTMRNMGGNSGMM